MDIFDLIGPIMVGPSSSHTAGAVRIGLAARKLLGETPAEANIYLHGSFAATGRGHGTDTAIIAGLLGMAPNDERIPESFAIAKEQGLKFSFGEKNLRNAHPNSALIELKGINGNEISMVGASIGGGRIQVRSLNGMSLCFSAEQPTLIVRNSDQPGSVADVSRALADLGINIATFQVSRDSRGGVAIMVIECDDTVKPETVEKIRQTPGILSAAFIDSNREVEN